MRAEGPGLRAPVTRPTKGIGLPSAETLAATGAQVAINGGKKAKVESVIGEIGGTVPSGRLVGAPGDSAGEVNIRVNNVSP